MEVVTVQDFIDELIDSDADVKQALLFVDVEVDIGNGTTIVTTLPVVEIPQNWNVDTNTFHLKARVKK